MAADPRALIAERIKASKRIAITSHLRPDGDSLCTALALALMSGLLGKEADDRQQRSDASALLRLPRPGRDPHRPDPGGGFRHRRPPRVRRRLPVRPGGPRRGLQDQHRPPSLQLALRRHQLDRSRSPRRRRDGLRSRRSSRRPAHARDRREPLLRHRLGYRLVPVLQYDLPRPGRRDRAGPPRRKPQPGRRKALLQQRAPRRSCSSAASSRP